MCRRGTTGGRSLPVPPPAGVPGSLARRGVQRVCAARAPPLIVRLPEAMFKANCRGLEGEPADAPPLRLTSAATVRVTGPAIVSLLPPFRVSRLRLYTAGWVEPAMPKTKLLPAPLAVKLR